MLAAWLAVVAAIVVASLLPGRDEPVPEEGVGITSLGHVPAYAALTAMTARLLTAVAVTPWRAAGAAAVASVALGALLEVVQPLVGRDGNLTDLALDGIGAGTAAFAWGYGWLPRQRETST